jgi:hypothetical protein
MVMVFHGKVCGNVVVLPPGVNLPEGLEVTVEAASLLPPVASSQLTMRNGVPVFPCAVTTSSADMGVVNELRDELP